MASTPKSKVNNQELGPFKTPGAWHRLRNNYSEMETCTRCTLCLQTLEVLCPHFCLLPFTSTCCLSSLMEVLVFAPACGSPPDSGGLVCYQLASRCLPWGFLAWSVWSRFLASACSFLLGDCPCLLHVRNSDLACTVYVCWHVGLGSISQPEALKSPR